MNQLLKGLHKVYVEDEEGFGLREVLKKMGQNISFVEKEEAEKTAYLQIYYGSHRFFHGICIY